ncbi:MAG: hypothetical protein J6C10_02475 [Prevotella sp.]|nr:hypothetical protein [Prevotella sp.]
MEKKIESLNKELPQFFLEELEQRLETDPLSVGGLFDLQAADGEDWCVGRSVCNGDNGCSDKSSCLINA